MKEVDAEVDAVQSDNNWKPFLLMAPSITPVYANNPAFRLVSFNKETLELSDYTQYNMDIILSNGIIIFLFNLLIKHSKLSQQHSQHFLKIYFVTNTI